jgi:hypothetical protein
VAGPVELIELLVALYVSPADPLHEANGCPHFALLRLRVSLRGWDRLAALAYAERDRAILRGDFA